MKAIIATNNKRIIGNNGELPWHNSEDLKHFKELTKNSTVLVGYNTYQKLPYLNGRTVIVDPREKLEDTSYIDWCIGGKKTYDKYSHLFSELHISVINNDESGDTKFPVLPNLNVNCKIFIYYFGF